MWRKSAIGIGLVLMFATSSGAQDRKVVVKSGEGELKRTAFRLGVSTQQVLAGRRMLREATDMVEEMPAAISFAPLGRVWLAVDRPGAEDGLTGLIELLREMAEDAPTSDEQARLLQSALTIATSLRIIAPEKARTLVEDWPESAQVGEPRPGRAPLDPAQARKYVELRELNARLRSDPDAALAQLDSMEDGAFTPQIGGLAALGLLDGGRKDDALRIAGRALALVDPSAPSESDLNAMIMLLSAYGQYGLLDEAGELMRRLTATLETYPSHSGGGRTIQGQSFTEAEFLVLGALGAFRNTPEAALRALGHFPAVESKVRDAGGLDAVLTNLLGTAQLSDLEGDQRRRMEMDNRISVIRSRQDPDGAVKELESLVPEIQNFPDASMAIDLMHRVIRNCFTLQGELSPKLRRQGLDLAKSVRKEAEAATPGTRPGPNRNTASDRLEALIHGIWLWSDPGEARAAMEELPPETRFRAMLGSLTSLATPHGRQWRWR